MQTDPKIDDAQVRPHPDARRIRLVRGGPILIEGPVEVELEDGTCVSSDRFVVALCACKRSKAFPFCDTSHRRRRVAK